MERMRFGGMATGLDTETMVKQMMQPFTMKVDKQKQAKQVMQWKQDIYRELINDIRGLKNSYMDSIKPNDNLLMKKNYSGYDISSSGATAATATAGVGAIEGSYTVDVGNLAEGAKINGTTLKNSVNSNTVTDYSLWQGKDITITIDGIPKSITVGAGVSNLTELVSDINTKFEGKLNVTAEGTTIRFESIDSKTVKIESAIADLGNKVINPLKNSTKLSEMGIAINDEININGTIITISDPSNMTIQQLSDKIASDTNGAVTARYSELTGQFSLETKITGQTASLNISGSQTLLNAFNINAGSAVGVDATVTISDPSNVPTTISKSTNDFTIDGINYSLKGTGVTTLTATANTDKTYDKIMGFITKYNELIDKVNGKLDQKKQYTYNPLTEEQKKDMEPDEIKIWEDKAKEGLIKGDSSLNSMLSSMRSAFFDSVDGVSISLKDLGFTTSRDYTQKGKIVIDESLTVEQAKQKFSDALKNNGPGVADFFSKSGETYSEKGIFQRLNDTVEAYTNPFGEKGILLKKAGIKGNTTEFKNLLSEQMIQKDKYISELTKKLAAKENSYYTKFARLEKAMYQMNAQSSWLTQQFSGGQ